MLHFTEAAGRIEHYRNMWEQSLDRLDAYLQELQTQEKKDGRLKEKKHSGRKNRIR